MQGPALLEEDATAVRIPTNWIMMWRQGRPEGSSAHRDVSSETTRSWSRSTPAMM